jgi:RNA-directed DNA polymerase
MKKVKVASNVMLETKQKEEWQWEDINFKRCETFVRRLQQSIAKAVQDGDLKKARKLQRILAKSKSARIIAVRKVTQDNRGKSTAGIDGVKSINPKQRLAMVEELKLNPRWKPVKQVEIPKKNGKVRTLGIPTMYDRACQALMKMTLEPSYEAVAEANSYGFRPGRSAHDAIDQIFNCTVHSKDRDIGVLEGDLKGFFDNIEPKAILESELIRHDPIMKHSIEKLIKAGALTVKHQSIDTDKGTPQGGVISPLLANIAFMGLEKEVEKWGWENRKLTGQIRRLNIKFHTIVYADDFVVIGPKAVLPALKEHITRWVKNQMGVELSQEKTKISNLDEGFNFLGFNIRRYDVSETETKLLTKPSKEAIKSVKAKIKAICKESKGLSQDVLIKKLNPVIRGWGNYYSHVVSKKIYSSIDNYIFERLWIWATGRHNNKGNKWIQQKYWQQIGTRNWVFKDTKTLVLMSDIKIVRHVKIKGNESPYLGNKQYWKKRGKQSETDSVRGKLAKKQDYCCNECGLMFMPDDIIEVDHIIPTSLGGTNKIENLQLLHGHCHDKKTKADGSIRKRVTRKKCIAH